MALATVLRHNASVALLDVQRPLINSLGEEAVAHFSQMLAVNRTLVELDLSKSGMRDHGLKLIAAELRHAPGSALKTLRLRCNQVELKEPSCVDEVAGLVFDPVACPLSAAEPCKQVGSRRSMRMAGTLCSALRRALAKRSRSRCHCSSPPRPSSTSAASLLSLR